MVLLVKENVKQGVMTNEKERIGSRVRIMLMSRGIAFLQKEDMIDKVGVRGSAK